MLFLIYLLSALAWMFTYDFDITWNRPAKFHTHFPSITDVDSSRLSQSDLDKFLSDRTLLVSQYHLLCNQLEGKYRKHKDGSLGTFAFFVVPFLLLAAKSAEIFPSEILDWILILAAGAISWLIISIIYKHYFKIYPFIFSENNYQSTLDQIEDKDLMPGESRDTYANYLVICSHHRYLTSVQDTVKLRFAIGRFFAIIGVVLYILCIPQML